MLTLGQRIKILIKARQCEPAELAETVRHHGDPRGARSAAATVESYLDHLLADQVDGVRFFFEDPQIAVSLLDALQAAESERSELMALAAQVIGGQAPPPALSRLRDAITGWTIDDWHNDPLLIRLVERLDPERTERLEFLHARASLLYRPLPPPVPLRPLTDWRTALETLLPSRLPSAKLRLPRERQPGYDTDALSWDTTDRELAQVQQWAEPTLSAAAPLDDPQPQPWWALLSAPPAGSDVIELDREETPMTGRFTERYGHETDPEPTLLIPRSATEPLDGAAWRDLYLCSTLLHRQTPPPAVLERVRSKPARMCWPLTCTFAAYQSETNLPRETWDEADRLLGIAVLALRRALRSAEDAVELADGRIVFPLAAGIVAQLFIRSCTSSDDPQLRASFDVQRRAKWWPSEGEWSILQDTFAGVTGHGQYARSSIVGYQLPVRLHLAAKGLRADVRFLTSPLAQPGPQGREHLVNLTLPSSHEQD